MDIRRPLKFPWPAVGRMSCAILLSLIAGWAVSPSVMAGEATAVQVEDRGDTLVMKNGLVEAIIDKKKAEVSSIALPGEPNLVPGGITFDATGFGTGRIQFWPHNNNARFTGGEETLVSSGPEMAEVKFTDPDFIHLLGAEMHLVMCRGVPGVYEYLVLKHGPGQTIGSVDQLRWTFRGDTKLITHAYGSATKQGKMIRTDAFKGSRQVGDVTAALDPKVAAKAYPEPTGHTHDGDPVYVKYDWTDTLENHVVQGLSTDTAGIFMVQPSLEYFNGGPTHGVLTVHSGFPVHDVPVSILEFLSGHFLIRDHLIDHFEKDQEWEQIIGPWLVYLNKGANPEELWKDAAARGLKEKEAWPYAWVKEDEALYPRKRGTMTGTLTLPGQSAAHALVVLAQPGEDWQTQTMGYEFWTRSDASGHFSIAKVRPGRYALYCSVPGALGEATVTDVSVNADGTTDLGTLQWAPPRREQFLWRLGTPDRSTEEFRFGSEPRQFGLWWRYMKEMGTKELNYIIGRSDPGKDWYYAQSVVAMPDGSYFSPVWNIHFNLKKIPDHGPAVLTIDLAGAAGGGGNHLDVSLNGHPIGKIDSPNDSGIYRSAVQSAQFRHHAIEFDPSLLKEGANTISLQLVAKKSWKQSPTPTVSPGGIDPSKLPEAPYAGVMYDCLQLEAGPVVSDGSCKVMPSR